MVNLLYMWVLFILLTAVESQTCPTYSCHAGGRNISPECGYADSNGNVILQACDYTNSSYCDTSGTITNGYYCSSVRSYVKPLAYPGEPCAINSDCLSGSCVSKVCQGLKPGSFCTSHSDCTVGTYCGPAFTCVFQLPFGSPCASDYECRNNLACNRTLFAEGLCVNYFSLPNGSPVGLCIDLVTESVSNLCQSGSCTLLNPGFDSVGICSGPYYIQSLNFPQTCTQNSDCVGFNGVNKTTGSCSCGMDMYGNAYCDAFNGDPPALTVTSLWLIHTLSSSIFNCHTLRRFDIFCLQQNLGADKIQLFLNNRALTTDTARYQNNDYCTKVIFNSQFFNITPANFGCQLYSCANQTFTQNTCITFYESNNNFLINPCNSTSQYSYCDYTKSNNNKWRNITCGVVPNPPVKYPGDTCANSSECILGNCSNGFCAGISLGNACTSSDLCDVGLYCKSVNYIFTCQPLIAAYQSGCGSDYDCVPNSGCNYNSAGPPGVCVPYYSLSLNSEVPCSASNLNMLCSTATCYYTGGYTGTCALPPKSSSPLPVSCTLNGQCSGTNQNGQSFQGTCTCGYNNQGSSYCTPFIGDSPGQSYTSITSAYLKSPFILNCQTTRRFSEDCFNLVSKALNINQNLWYIAYLNFTLYPYLVANDACVKSVYTNSYWSLFQDNMYGDQILNNLEYS
jgi:hypothetical protein